MLYRIKQFIRGFCAKKPTAEEMQFINLWLPPKGRKLFAAMNTADQRHSLNVLYTAKQNLERDYQREADADYTQSYSFVLLARCCLLHDIGRGHFMGPIRKSIAVLLDKIFPIWARQHGRYASESYIGGLLHRYYHHAELSAELLQKNGFLTEARIVALHHKKGSGWLNEEERKVLELLREADGMN